MTNNIQNIFFGDSKSIRIALTINDEHLLKEVAQDNERWMRITPSGKSQHEPLFEKIERIDQKNCLITPGPYVGKIKLNDTVLNLLPPKWLNELTSSHLMYMLSRSFNHNPKVTYLPEFITENNTSVSELTEPLYFFFISELRQAIKKGMYKTYEEEKIISSKLRGRLNFKQQLKLNSQGKALFATEQQIFSENNDVNRILSQATKIIIDESIVDNTLEIALQMKKKFKFYSNLGSKNLDKVKIARRGNHLKTSLELAKLIVSGESISYKGDNSNTFSMVLNLFDLFEKYISNELYNLDKHYDNNFNLPLAGLNTMNTSWNNRKIFPDIVYLENTPKQVIDIKFKKITKFGPKISDIYQISFYSSLLGLDKGILIFPTSNKSPEIFNFPTSYNGQQKIEIIAYGIPVTVSITQLEKEIKDLYLYLLSLKNP